MRITAEIDIDNLRKALYAFYLDYELNNMTDEELFEVYKQHFLNQKIMQNIMKGRDNNYVNVC